jgi:hypothetical protein
MASKLKRGSGLGAPLVKFGGMEPNWLEIKMGLRTQSPILILRLFGASSHERQLLTRVDIQQPNLPRTRPLHGRTS